MSKAVTVEEEVRAVVHQVNEQIQDLEPSPFSPPAFATLKDKIGQYVIELVNESINVSKRHRADIVSSAYVERASEYLVSSTTGRLYRHLGTVGGILLGAALSNILAMTLAGRYTGGGTILSAALGIGGAFMIALHIAKD
jgi:hypothetical protein